MMKKAAKPKKPIVKPTAPIESETNSSIETDDDNNENDQDQKQT
jgi:hypothetical protein